MSAILYDLGLLLRLRLLSYRNSLRFAPPVHRLIGGGLALGATLLFLVILAAFGGFLTATRTQQGPALMRLLIERAAFYLFLFLVAGGIPFVSGVLLTAGDLSLLAGTPVRPAAVVLARLLDSVVVSSAQFVVIGVPLLVASMWALAPGMIGWLAFLALVLLYLILPALLVAALLLALARAVGLRRVRIAVAVASAILSVALCLVTVAEFSQRANQGWSGLTLEAPSPGAIPPTPAWVPSTWFSDALFAIGDGRAGDALLSSLLLLLATFTVGALCVLLGGPVLIGERLLEGEGGGDGTSSGRSTMDRFLALLPLAPPVQAIIAKDLRYVARDLVLLSQIGIPVILYLVPFVIGAQMGREAMATPDLFFLAAGIVGTITYMETSILGLSSIGLEGRAFWLVLSAPVSAAALVRAKWLGAFGLSLALTVPLFLLSCLLFRVSGLVTGAGVSLLIISCAALCGFGVGLSGLFPRFVYENPAHRASLSALIWGFVGATLYVLFSALFLGGGYFAGEQLPRQAAWFIGVGIGFYIVLSLGICVLPLSVATVRLNNLAWEA
jgi:ABC-2 type transport system permease protein